MDSKLTRTCRELRRERCPEGVLERVTKQIAENARERRRRSLRWVVPSLAGLTSIVLALVLWLRPNPSQAVAGVPKSEAELVRQQTVLTLAYFGKAIQRAGSQSSETILEVSLPPLRQGLRTAEDVISPRDKR